jgi:hypothetical protein
VSVQRSVWEKRWNPHDGWEWDVAINNHRGIFWTKLVKKGAATVPAFHPRAADTRAYPTLVAPSTTCCRTLVPPSCRRPITATAGTMHSLRLPPPAKSLHQPQMPKSHRVHAIFSCKSPRSGAFNSTCCPLINLLWVKGLCSPQYAAY